MLHLEPGWHIILQRGIRRGCRTLRREHDWIGTLGALTGIFILLQLLGLGLATAMAGEQLLKQRTELQLELKTGTTDRDISDLIIQLQELPYITKANFITREQAYDRARMADPDLIGFLEEYGLNNPFNDSVTITLTSLEHYRELLRVLEHANWQRIVDPSFLSDATAEQEYVEALLTLTQGMRTLVLFILGIGVATLLFIVVNLTRTRALAREEEVLVERIAGAQTATILLPFAAEASILLSVATIGSFIVTVLLAAFAPMIVPALHLGGALGELWNTVRTLLYTAIPIAFVLELLLVPVIASVGAWIGIAPQVRSPRIAMM
jgi:cell division protein FtsX